MDTTLLTTVSDSWTNACQLTDTKAESKLRRELPHVGTRERQCQPGLGSSKLTLGNPARSETCREKWSSTAFIALKCPYYIFVFSWKAMRREAQPFDNGY